MHAWDREDSAFHASGGLIPPYRTRRQHRALLAERVPRAPSVPFTGTQDSETLVVDLLRDLAALHTEGVVLRRIRPDLIGHDGVRACLVLTDEAMVDGLGVPLDMDTDWDAPERTVQVGLVSADLYALGRTLRAVLTDPSPGVLAVVEGLLASDPDDRARAALAALSAFGGTSSTQTARDPLLCVHPGLADWSWSGFVDELVDAGEPWAVITRLDAEAEEGARLWQLRGAAGRLLRHAARLGGTLWLVLGAACALLAEREPVHQQAFRLRQVDECIQRSGLGARPEATAIRRGATTFEAALRLHRLATAKRLAGASMARRARVALRQGDLARALGGLAGCSAEDPEAWTVAASVVLETDARRLTPDLALTADPVSVARAARLLVTTGHERMVSRVADALDRGVEGAGAALRQVGTSAPAGRATDSRSAAGIESCAALIFKLRQVARGVPDDAASWRTLFNHLLDKDGLATSIEGAMLACREQNATPISALIAVLAAHGRWKAALQVAPLVTLLDEPPAAVLAQAIGVAVICGDRVAADGLRHRLQDTDLMDPDRYVAEALWHARWGTPSSFAAAVRTAEQIGAPLETVAAMRASSRLHSDGRFPAPTEEHHVV